jgi:adenosylhomocysteine nucleosidase
VKALVCFAVAQEKQYFRTLGDVQVLVTGMGAGAAASALTKSLEASRPSFIIAAGFAGGLNPELKLGQVILDDAGCTEHGLNLLGNNSFFRGKIHSSSKVVVTPEAKARLREDSNADAVDMESESIRLVAKNHGIPMVAIRVISDAFDTSLPLDFNQFMNDKGGMRHGRLVCHLIRHPGKVAKLMSFQRKIQHAAQKLGEHLNLLFKTPG